MRLYRRALLALVVVSLAVVPAARAADRIVAIGDIHGSYDGLVTILRAAGLADENLSWSGGTTVMVQTGDFLDRGSQVKEVVGLLRRLQEEAPAAGGRVEILLGNHEALNLLGVMRDVASETFAAFVEEGSEKRREESYRQWLKWARQRAKRFHLPTPDDSPAGRAAWMEKVPLGMLEYLDWLAPEGELGSYLRKLPIVTTIDGLFFVHGGLPPPLGSLSDQELNERVWQEERTLDDCRQLLLKEDVIHETTDPNETIDNGLQELTHLTEQAAKVPEPLRSSLIERARTLQACVNYPDWWLVTSEGPLWFRGFAHWPETEGNPLVDALVEAKGVRAFIVGHTTQRGRIGERFGGRVFLIDTGMLTSFYSGGQPAALEIVGDRFTAIYERHREVLVGGTSGGEEDVEGARSSHEGGVSPQTVHDGDGAGGGEDVGFDAAPARVYHDAAGNPLPFQDVDSILDFLTTADIIESKRIRQGINQPWKLTLERNGVRTHAVFREVNVKKERYRESNGLFYPVFRDSYIHEVAAFELARMLGVEGIPPVVLRPFRGNHGSVQLWIENVIDDKTRIERGIDPPGVWWVQQRIVRDVFDALIANTDRNSGNILIETDTWTLWLIDHTRSFFEQTDLMHLDDLAQCERGLYEKLKGLDRQQVAKRLEPYLHSSQIDVLFERWDLLLQHFDALIREKGEQSVLFDMLR